MEAKGDHGRSSPEGFLTVQVWFRRKELYLREARKRGGTCSGGTGRLNRNPW
jgi:hypothetical protein